MSKVWFWISPNAKKILVGGLQVHHMPAKLALHLQVLNPQDGFCTFYGIHWALIIILLVLCLISWPSPRVVLLALRFQQHSHMVHQKSTSLLKISLHKGCRWLSDTKLPTKCEWVWCLEMDLHPTSVPVKGAGFTMTLTKIKQLLKMDVVKQIV